MQDIRNTAQGILYNPDTAQRLRLTYEALVLLNQNDQGFESAIKALQSASGGSSSPTVTIRPDLYVGTYAATFVPVFANGLIQQITLTGGIAISAPSDATYQIIEFLLVQDATGGRTITFAADYFGIPNDFITAANTYTWIRFVQRVDGKLACTGMLSGQSWP